MPIQLSNRAGPAMPWTDRIGRRIKLRDLHIALAVAQAGSIARAAQQLAISQPVVSRVIADLEQVLGVRLFDRSRQGAEPTIYGRAVLDRGVAAFDELKQCVKDIEFLRDPGSGELRIAGTEPMVAGLIPQIVDQISRLYPRVAFQVTQAGSAAAQFRELRERNVELFIGRLPRSIAEDDLDIEVLFDEPLLVVAGKRNPWTRRPRIELADLMDEPWVLPRPDGFVGTIVREFFQSAGLPLPTKGAIHGPMQMNDALLATGRFLAIYSGSLLRYSAKRLSIKVLPVNVPLRSSPVVIVTLKNRTISPVARLFIDHARKAGTLPEFRPS
jgi:DNA-binding transcriptional LysR family regulator